jgi:hypothetical protein
MEYQPSVSPKPSRSKRRKTFIGTLLLALLVGLVGYAYNEYQAYWGKRSAQAGKIAETLRQNIQGEIKTLGNHEWAGEYYEGDGLGVKVSLILAPRTGYVFTWYGCMGLYDRNYGAVTWDKDRLRLAFTFPNRREGFRGISPELIPIAWGERKYLVPPDRVRKFCNDVNGCLEPRKSRHGFFLLRVGDEEKEAQGLPDVPPAFKQYLLARLIDTEIVGIGASTIRSDVPKQHVKETAVILNRGEKHGLRKGMRLNVVQPQDVVGSVEITETEEERSEGIMIQIGDETVGPQIGWKLSIRPS